MMRLEVDGVEQIGLSSPTQIRQILSTLDPHGDTIVRLTDGRDNLDVVRLPDGFHLTGNDPADRQQVFNTAQAIDIETAVEAMVAYRSSGRTPERPSVEGASVPKKKGSGRSMKAMAVVFLASLVACAIGLALLSRDVAGEVSTPTYVAGIASLILWAVFSFMLLSSGMAMAREWLGRKLDVRIEQKISTVDGSWRVLDEGRWVAKLIVGVVPLLIALVPLLGALIGGSLFFIVG